MISGTSPMGPDDGRLRPIVFTGGPCDGTVTLYPCRPEDDLPETLACGGHAGSGADRVVYRRCGANSQGTVYRWEPAGLSSQ